MRLLLDTHLLLWAAGQPERLSIAARALLQSEDNELLFSVASLWEVAIKRGLGRADFTVDARLLRRALIDNGYQELPVHGTHVAALENLPALHKDLFDRMLIAQAQAEAITLLTSDPAVAKYAGPIQSV